MKITFSNRMTISLNQEYYKNRNDSADSFTKEVFKDFKPIVNRTGISDREFEDALILIAKDLYPEVIKDIEEPEKVSEEQPKEKLVLKKAKEI